jgi:hypothetical protein
VGCDDGWAEGWPDGWLLGCVVGDIVDANLMIINNVINI